MLVLLCLGSISLTLWGQEVVDRILVVVDENIILESEVLQFAQSLALQNRVDPATYLKDEKVKEQILQQLVDQQVLLAKAKEDTTIIVEDREVKRELESRLEMLVKEVGSENELERLYGMPVRDIKREFEKNIHDGLMVEKLRQKKLSSVKVSKLEVEEFYAENKDQLSNRPETVDLAHILFLVAPAMEADKRARSLIDSIQTILESGANFEELAKKFSQDPGSAKRGGLLGWTKRGDLVPEYEEMAYTLNPGQISPPVRSKFGYHIIRLNERQGEKINTSHILVKLQASSEDKARARAQADSIYNLLLQEGDFAELAKEFSYDKETAPLGGDLGTFPLSELASIYAEKIKAMKVGDFTTPFESQMGIQILKLLNRQTPRPLTLEHDWEQISVMALNWKQEKVYQNWLETLKKDVYIEVKK